MKGWRRGDIDLELGGVTEWAERMGRKYERGNDCNCGAGVALAGVILTSLRGTEARLGAQIKDLRGEVGELRERMAKLEGLLEGLREAITGRAAAS